MKQRGFTLIELMIVVAIIGILVAIVLPALVDDAHDCPMTAASIREAKQVHECLQTERCTVTAEQHALMRSVETKCPRVFSGSAAAPSPSPPKVE